MDSTSVVPRPSAAGSAPIGAGRVLQVNVSRGGVPKLAVERARVSRFGLEGDGHHDYTDHGGPHRAVCLFGTEAIERLQAEGHPIAPGTAGENLTTIGIEWSTLPVGARARIGERLELEISSSTTPCATQKGNFTDGNFNRILIDRHPSDSRMYARVITDGEVKPGDAISVSEPADTLADDMLTLRWLERAERKSSVAAWKAAAEAGFEIEIFEDGEIAMSSSRELPGPAFNQAVVIGLPNLLSMATDFYERHRTPGWIWTDDPPWADAREDLVLDIFGGAPANVIEVPPPAGVTIRQVRKDEASTFEGVHHDRDGAGGVDPEAENPWPRVMRQLGRSGARHIFVAAIDGKQVGNASLHVTAKTGWLRGAVVAPEFQGRGIQGALISARARLAADLGCNLVGASAEPAEASARNLVRAGLRPLGRHSSYAYEPRSRG